MAFERIELDVNANGVMKTFHTKQFDVGRPIILDLVNGDDAYTPAAGVTFELHCRKVDDNIVIISTYDLDGNTLTFASTEQLTACVGKNLATVKMFHDEMEIGTMNFFLDVTIDPDFQGLTSETQIETLYEQVEEITEQVIGDNYYDKTEVDDLLDTKADAATTYTKTEVDTALNLKADKSDTYTKTETNNLLAGKADASDTYSKAQVDNALALKANSADLATVATTGDYDDLLNKPTIPAAQVQSDYAQTDNTQVDYIKNKPDIEGMIADVILDIMPVDTASGPIASFDTELAVPLVNVSCNVLPTGGNGTPDNPIPINGYTEANITANGDVITISFGQTVYGGVLDVTNGTLTVTHAKRTFNGSETWYYSSTYNRVYTNIPDTKINSAFISNILTNSQTVADYNGYINDQKNLIIYAPASITSSADWRTWLGSNPLEVCYELATPFDIDLTPVQIRALVGENNVYSDTNGNTTVQFKDSIQHYIDTKVGS